MIKMTLDHGISDVDDDYSDNNVLFKEVLNKSSLVNSFVEDVNWKEISNGLKLIVRKNE